MSRALRAAAVLAFAALASALLPAAPVEAQSTVWTGGLTADSNGLYAGCDDTSSRLDNCSSVLNPRKFTFEGVERRVTKFQLHRGRLSVEFNLPFAHYLLRQLKLRIGGSEWDLADYPNSDRIEIGNAGISPWRDGQVSTVKLIKKASTPKQAIPVVPRVPARTVSTMAGNGQVTLTWANPNHTTNTFPYKYRWEYQRKEGTGTWSNWEPVMTQCDCDVYRGQKVLHTVAGLNNGKRYGFQVRALGKVDASNTAWATPMESIAPVRVTPGPGANALTLEWSPPPGYWGCRLYEGYELQWKSGTEGWDGGRSLWFACQTVRHTLRYLQPGTSYTVRVLYGASNRRVVIGEVTATTSSGQRAQRNTPGFAPPPDNTAGQESNLPESPPPNSRQEQQPDTQRAVLPPDDPIERTGTNGPDDLEGAGGDDLLMGKRGNDVLRGLGGHDELRGGPGNDEVLGGSGDDELIGGRGDDTYTGGPGADRFVFSLKGPGDKIINDFDAAEGDVIVLSAPPQGRTWRSVADIIATAVAQGSQYTVYTLSEGLTVETDVPLRAEDFLVE